MPHLAHSVLSKSITEPPRSITFRSVDQNIKQLQRQQKAEHFFDISEKGPHWSVVLDGPDIGFTKHVTSHDRFRPDYQANLLYCQNNQKHYDVQEANLQSLHAFQKEWIHSHLRFGDIAKEIGSIQPKKSKPLRLLDLDGMSFSRKTYATFAEVLRRKREKRDLTPITVHIVDVVKPSQRRLTMLHKLNEQKHGCFTDLLKFLEETSELTDMDRFNQHYGVITELLRKFGFELSHVSNVLPVWSGQQRCRVEKEMVSIVYGDEENGGTMMRYTFFEANPVENGMDLEEEDEPDYRVFKDVDLTDLVDEDEGLREEILELVTELLSTDHSNSHLLDSVFGLSPREVVDHLIDIALPTKDPRKLGRWLVIYGLERSGKTIWEYLIAFIQKTLPFLKYLSRTFHVHGVKTTVLHCSLAPYVVKVEADQVLKSDAYSFHHPTVPQLQSLNRKAKIEPKNNLQTFVTGQSKTRAEFTSKLIQMRSEANIETVLLFDEADAQLGGSTSSHERIMRDNLHHSAVCGIVLVTATTFPLLRTDPSFRVFPRNAKITTFIVNPPTNYRGLESYDPTFDLSGDEKLEIDEVNGIINNINDYLSRRLTDLSLFNCEQKQRGFPLALVMPTNRVEGPDGFKAKACEISAGNYENIKYPETGNPICICVQAGSFHVYADGIDVHEKRKEENLQSLIPKILRRYEYKRHLIIWGFNMMTRSITCQFEDSFENYNILGFISNIVACFKMNAGGRKRKGDTTERIREHTRAVEVLSQQLCRACCKTNDFDIPFFVDFKICASITKELLNDIKNEKKKERKMLEVLFRVQDIDKMWSVFKEESDEPIEYSRSLRNIGTGAKKQKLEEIYEVAEIDYISRQEKDGTWSRAKTSKDAKQRLWSRMTEYGLDVVKFMVNIEQGIGASIRTIVENSFKYWEKYEKRERRKDARELKKADYSSNRLSKILGNEDSEAFTTCIHRRQNPAKTREEYLYWFTPDFLEYCKEQLDNFRLPCIEYQTAFEEMLEDAAIKIEERLDIEEKREIWKTIPTKWEGIGNNDGHWLILCYMFCRTGQVVDSSPWCISQEDKDVLCGVGKMDKSYVIRNLTHARRGWREPSANGIHLRMDERTGEYRLAWK